MTIEIDGVVETLVPGRDRLSIDHDFVARDPEQFEACWKRDVKVRSQLRDMIERSRTKSPAPSGYGRDGSALEVPTPSNNYGVGGSLNVPDPPEWAP